MESSVYQSDRDLTGEEYIADINENWYIHAHTALCCFHNIVLFHLYSNKIYLYKPWILLAFVFAFVNSTITFLNLIVFEVVLVRNPIWVPENLPQNCSCRTSKSCQIIRLKHNQNAFLKQYDSYCPFFLEFKSISTNSARDFWSPNCMNIDGVTCYSVSYTHLTLPTKLEV